MQVLDKIVLSLQEPSQTTVLWAKPMEGGFAFYLFDNGRWKAMNVVSDMGTPTTDDDTVADITNIPQIVQDEVSRQMEGHDDDVNDTHNASTSDDTEYPDVDMF